MARLITHALLFLLIVSVSLVAIVLAIPDGNDYAKAIIDKHARLERTPHPRLIFVGGSSMAYGLDSPTIEKELPYSVVNMGMMAFLGLRFMLDEIRPDIRRGDVVVLCPDYNTYQCSVDGHGEDLLAVVKVRPKSIVYFQSLGQLVNLVMYLPYAASTKIMARVTEALQVADTERPLIDFVNRTTGSRNGFNKYGDMIAHTKIRWVLEFDHGKGFSELGVDQRIIPLINEFYQYVKDQGGTVVVAYPPLAERYFNDNNNSIDSLRKWLKTELVCPIIGSPSDYVYPDEYFFDSVYHLNGHGKMIRTKKVIADLRSVLAESSAARRHHSLGSHMGD
jgi:hypothetical protein